MSDTARQGPQPDAPARPDADDGAGASRPGVAAFDFDGTLARKDTLVSFLTQTHGWHRVVGAAAVACLRTRQRDELKVAAVGRLFRGMPRVKLEELGAAYAQQLPDVLRPELVERIGWHRDQDHAVVIVSAGLTAYLRPLGEHLGLDHVMGVDLLHDDAGVLTGEVVGGVNCRGPEKVARLQGWLDSRYGPDTDVELWAYGDSSGDEELLARADHPTWVGRRAATTAD